MRARGALRQGGVIVGAEKQWSPYTWLVVCAGVGFHELVIEDPCRYDSLVIRDASCTQSAFERTTAMLAIKNARKFIESRPEDPAAKILSALVIALETETAMAITDLYQLDYEQFKLALAIIDEWRLDRHYASKFRLIDVSLQIAPSDTVDTP